MHRLLLITTTFLALLAAGLPAVAAGARSYEVTGGGFGHGVGLSQYGAYGYAQEGWGHRRILSHYYRGTDHAEVRRERVRVLLQASRPAPASFSNAVRVERTPLDPRQSYTVSVSRHSKMVVRDGSGDRVGRFAAPLLIRGDQGQVRLGGEAMNGLSNGLYRGRMELRPGLSGGVTAINDVGVDDYVRGVISVEMPASWHPEALRAQAVVARSYALATNAGGDLFDQYPDTRSQVYRGVAAEYDSTNQAVESTAGRVVMHDGRVAKTFFFSTSGGHTEDVENVFGGDRIAYLRGVEDRYDGISPFHRWSRSLSRSEMEDRLGSLVVGRLRGVRVLERGASPRIIRARVRGSEGSTEVSGATLMYRLGTYDIPSEIRKVRTAASAGAARHAAMPDEGAVVATSAVPEPPKG